MKRLFGGLAILFSLLTLAGAGYVLLNHGRLSAGFAVVPMLFALICWQAFRASSGSGGKR